MSLVEKAEGSRLLFVAGDGAFGDAQFLCRFTNGLPAVQAIGDTLRQAIIHILFRPKSLSVSRLHSRFNRASIFPTETTGLVEMDFKPGAVGRLIVGRPLEPDRRVQDVFPAGRAALLAPLAGMVDEQALSEENRLCCRGADPSVVG